MQQPQWSEPSQLHDAQAYLRDSAPLIRVEDVLVLRETLAKVAAGEAMVIQSGDCAEDMSESSPNHVARKAAVLDMLAGALRLVTQQPVVRVGRIAGQFAKPRSNNSERIGDVELPVYRGDMVNGREAVDSHRQHDAQRLVRGYRAAQDIMQHLAGANRWTRSH
ncbi:hypothetical protein P308_27375 [Pseudomonas piscis]|nr:hypothetical protein P308_27375 [Pseudomonas piscis]